MTVIGADIAQEAHGRSDVYDQQIKPPIMIEVGASETSSHRGLSAKCRVRSRDLAKSPRAIIGQKLVGLSVGLPKRIHALQKGRRGVGALHSPVRDRQIEVTVSVKVCQQRSESSAAQAQSGQAGGNGFILE